MCSPDASDYGQMKVYREDPLEVAREFETQTWNICTCRSGRSEKGKVVNWEVIEEFRGKRR